MRTGSTSCTRYRRTDIPDIDRAIFDEMMKRFRFAD